MDPSSSSLLDLAAERLMELNDVAEADQFLDAYDMRIQFTVRAAGAFHATIKDGKVQSVSAGAIDNFSNRDDLEIFGDVEAFRMVFEGRVSPATAMYYGKMTPRGERAKHNQACVAYTLLRIAQAPRQLMELR